MAVGQGKKQGICFSFSTSFYVFAVDPVLLDECDCNTFQIIPLESYEGNHFHPTSSSLFNKVLLRYSGTI